MTRLMIDTDRLLELVRDGHTNAEIAAALGCTLRTIQRRRAADRELSQAIIDARRSIAEANAPGHGSHARYVRGCRCRPCTSANTIRCRNERLARRARNGLPPPDPNRGRRRSVAETVVRGEIFQPSRDTLIAQAIARGERTTAIMQRLACSYEAVAAVRASMDEAVAS